MGLTVKDTLNLIFCLASSALIAYGPMAHAKGGPGVAFTYHPFLMGIGFTFLISIGFWMFNYEDLPGEWIDTAASRRKVHAMCQASGALCILAGYFAVVRAHGTSGAVLFQVSDPPMGFASGPGWLRLAHIVVGYAALALLVLQVFIGVMKYRALSDLDELNDDAFSVHQHIGNLLYFLGLCNVTLGVWLWEAWSLPMRSVITLTLLTSLAFGPRWDGGHGFLSNMVQSSATSPVSAHGRVIAGGGGRGAAPRAREAKPPRGTDGARA
mmetsp:Transcript_40938/g.127349  ORF Transcript_40938/g.127349 Transcript_40938/m.127349 type:complete len:268 (+) Transcript_40938:158-961(+)